MKDEPSGGDMNDVSVGMMCNNKPGNISNRALDGGGAGEVYRGVILRKRSGVHVK